MVFMGVVLLLFVVGLELSLGRIREVGRVAVAAGLGQVVFTAVLGFGLCLVLGFQAIESVFIATALTFSSTAVVVKLLDQKNELHTLYGQIAVGIFLVQDMVVVVALTFLAGLGSTDAMRVGGIAVGLARSCGGMGLLLVGALVGGRLLLPPVLGWAAASPRTLFIWMELADAGAYWLEALVLSLFVLIGNPLIFIWIIARFGYSERTSVLTGVTVAQISEFSFVFAAMGLSMGLISQPVLSVVGVVGVATNAIAAYMILCNHELYALLRRAGLLRFFRAGALDDEERPRPRLRDHVIVVGMNDLGRRVASLLHENGQTVLAIDTDGRKMIGLACPTLGR
jgi:predicted Kef-type K+ transport protein